VRAPQGAGRQSQQRQGNSAGRLLTQGHDADQGLAPGQGSAGAVEELGLQAGVALVAVLAVHVPGAGGVLHVLRAARGGGRVSAPSMPCVGLRPGRPRRDRAWAKVINPGLASPQLADTLLSRDVRARANDDDAPCPAPPPAAGRRAAPQHRWLVTAPAPAEGRAGSAPAAPLTVRSKYLLFSPYLACTLTEALRDRRESRDERLQAAWRLVPWAPCAAAGPDSTQIERRRLEGRVRFAGRAPGAAGDAVERQWAGGWLAGPPGPSCRAPWRAPLTWRGGRPRWGARRARPCRRWRKP
jgi:hypothetical protein